MKKILFKQEKPIPNTESAHSSYSSPYGKIELEQMGETRSSISWKWSEKPLALQNFVKFAKDPYRQQKPLLQYMTK